MASKDVKQEVTPVEIEGDDLLKSNTSIGVESDDLSLAKIIGWASAIIALIVVFFVALPYAFNIASDVKKDELAKTTISYELKELRDNEYKSLNTFGIVDKENGVYRMPIDSVINILSVD